MARASRVLELSSDVTPRIAWEETFSEYFNVMVDNGRTSVLVVPDPQLRDEGGELGTNQAILEETRNFFIKLTQSETFRGLLNRAVADGSLGKTSRNRWTIRVMREPYQNSSVAGAARFPVDRQQLTISVPYLQNKPESAPFYLSQNGQLVMLTPRRATVRNFVEMLTGERLPSTSLWSRNGRLDPQTFKTWGLGERGALDYLAERIMREIELPMSPLLSHLPFDRSHGTFSTASATRPQGNTVGATFQWNPMVAQAIKDAGGLSSLQKYVDLQNRYLDSVFPLGRTSTVFTPEAAAGNTGVMTSHFSRSTAAATSTPTSTSISTPALQHGQRADLQALDIRVPDNYARLVRDGEPASISETETVAQLENALGRHVDLAGREPGSKKPDHAGSPAGWLRPGRDPGSLECVHAASRGKNRQP